MQRKIDLNGDGNISFDEFVMMMRLGGMETDYEKEINGAFTFFDKNGDGQVCRFLHTTHQPSRHTNSQNKTVVEMVSKPKQTHKQSMNGTLTSFFFFSE